MEDRYAYERALLRYMLTIRTREGLPVVWAETLLREFVEDLGAGLQCYEGDPAVGEDDEGGGDQDFLRRDFRKRETAEQQTAADRKSVV